MGFYLVRRALDPASSAYPKGFHKGNRLGLTKVDEDLNALNILYGVTIFGVSGTHGFYDRWYARTIKEAVSQGLISPAYSKAVNCPVAGIDIEAIDDQPLLNINLFSRQPALSRALTGGFTPNGNIAKTPTPVRQVGLELPIAGAVADDGGLQTDETTQAQQGTANDMTLLPAIPAVDDAYYLGADYKVNWYWLNIGTAGVGNWTTLVEYWDGSVWKPAVNEVDSTNQFMASGLHSISHTPQSDWAKSTIQGKNLYWIRVRITAYNNITTQPKGTQAWYEVLI